ncbi:hypothetical protein X839_02845 [Streptococcus thermophilus MTH17CL396]|nr:hypothetical protein X839_02845 [Streptococcus thermophilus MTH17CL396]EWM62266.1 hypothetical protein Y022_03100 [Streptococcus thermophilus TH1477]CAD0143461.1 conserved protein of unknown function [Streptococcus thermophilus]CAD0143889.1 conserved protein of unknown function [Streptococcus thermophilus]
MFRLDLKEHLMRLSAVRKVLETLVFQELGIFENKTVWGNCFSLSLEIKK